MGYIVKGLKVRVGRTHQALAEVIEAVMNVRLSSLDPSFRIKFGNVNEFCSSRALQSLVVCYKYAVL